MTSIEWLQSKLKIYGLSTAKKLEIHILFEQAKLLHKQEIIDAYNIGSYDMAEKEFRPEQYYQETFVSKGSDDQVPEVRKMVEDDVEKLAKEYAKQFDYAEDSSPHLDFVAGYNKAKETLYTEEQVREALKYGVDNSEIIKRGCKDIEGFIQSLKQPKQ